MAEDDLDDAVENDAPPQGEQAAEGADEAEKKPGKEEAKADEEPKVPLTKAEKTLYAINILVILSAAGFVVWKLVLFKRERIFEAKQRQEIAQKAKMKEFNKGSIDLGEITINVGSEREGFRYLQIQIEMEATEATIVEIEKRKALILDKIVKIGTSKKFMELRSVQGKLLFKDQIKRATDEILGDRTVHAVNFSSYLLQ